jgi:hypothetical protein
MTASGWFMGTALIARSDAMQFNLPCCGFQVLRRFRVAGSRSPGRVLSSGNHPRRPGTLRLVIAPPGQLRSG